jgi:hypothetical protein
VVAGESGEVGNPGTLGMRKERVVVKAGRISQRGRWLLFVLCGGGGPGVWAPTDRERLEKCGHSARSVIARRPEAGDGSRGAAGP